MYKHFFKRLFDFIISLVALPFVLILCLFVWIAIKFDDGGPLFHMASRIGKGGRIFKMFKFRSMIVNAPDLRMEDGSTYNAEDDPRVTKVGKFLRKTSMDELPQLINILLGQMSLVGPRPVTEPELVKYGEYKDYVLSVSPGLTGMWQVSGRSDTGYEERISFDTYYIQNWSIWLDIWILIKTVWVVLKGKGAY